MEKELNQLIDWINETGSKIPYVGPLGLMLLILIGFGLVLLAVTFVSPFVIILVVIVAVIYFLLKR